MTKDQIDMIVEMYRDERQYSAISKETGLSVCQVKRWVRYNRDAYGLTRRRGLADKVGATSVSAEMDSKWNSALSSHYLSKRWGDVNRECDP